ncbi:hypothetical protein LEN26_003454 [Aphanomyces euteiches]|nr:hypothetical protein AeMF1_014827 [Aphanomyces euteiches]KAH9154099.1 hypothetical protein LEN26_003454 [Aphanomyces euteiches]KAH9187643.1 hypothetical protein AeNC1_010376 [Aphanomyces euteiches]
MAKVPSWTRKTYMHMDVCQFINRIDEGKTRRTVLRDQYNEGIDEGLTDIVQLIVDFYIRQIVWELACLTAAALLENKVFKDILGFTVDSEAEAQLSESYAPPE